MLGSSVLSQPVRPGSTRMHHVPGWFLRVVSSTSGIMVAETLDGRVPDGRELLYEQRFTERYPHVVHDQVAAGEIRELQVLHLGDGLSVLVQSSEQQGAGSDTQATSSAGASGYGLADVDRSLESSVPVALGYGRVWWRISRVVDGVDASANLPASAKSSSSLSNPPRSLSYENHRTVALPPHID